MNEVMKSVSQAGRVRIPEQTPLEEIELLSGSDAGKLCHIERKIIYAAMDKYKATKGALGLAFIVHDGASRRMIRRASLRRWLEQLERRSIYA